MTNKIRITGAAAAGPARVLVLGAGEIGSVYAGGLLQAGHHVVIVARGQRLADLRTRKVIGIGLLALGQFAVVALTGTSAAIWAGRHLPARTPESIAPIMLWFLLGHVFYCRAFAAAGTSSSRQAETPTTAGTLIPPPAPMTMPARMLLGPRSTLGTPGVCRRHARRDVRPRPAGRASLLRNHLAIRQPGHRTRGPADLTGTMPEEER